MRRTVRMTRVMIRRGVRRRVWRRVNIACRFFFFFVIWGKKGGDFRIPCLPLGFLFWKTLIIGKNGEVDLMLVVDMMCLGRSVWSGLCR